jgi:hypothetical protein
MNTQLPRDYPPPERLNTPGEGSQILPPQRFSPGRLALAFALATLADGLSIFWALTPPVQWAADLVTAIALFIVLGWQWILLPGLIMEAIPGVYIFPFWLLVVAAVAMWGTVRPNLKSWGHSHAPLNDS